MCILYDFLHLFREVVRVHCCTLMPAATASVNQNSLTIFSVPYLFKMFVKSGVFALAFRKIYIFWLTVWRFLFKERGWQSNIARSPSMSLTMSIITPTPSSQFVHQAPNPPNRNTRKSWYDSSPSPWGKASTRPDETGYSPYPLWLSQSGQPERFAWPWYHPREHSAEVEPKPPCIEESRRICLGILTPLVCP